MMSTVTTATIDTLSTTDVASLALVALLTLLILLVQKELLRTSQHESALRLSRMLNVAIVPLLIVFAVMVIMKALALLR